RALEADGIVPLEKAVDEAEASLAKADGTLEGLKARIAELDAEQAKLLDETGDPALKSALDDMAAAIAREDLGALYRAALRTPNLEDETIVIQLKDIDKTLTRKTAEAEGI